MQLLYRNHGFLNYASCLWFHRINSVYAGKIKHPLRIAISRQWRLNPIRSHARCVYWRPGWSSGCHINFHLGAVSQYVLSVIDNWPYCDKSFRFRHFPREYYCPRIQETYRIWNILSMCGNLPHGVIVICMNTHLR
jgi:hypothetical protein